MFFPIKNTKISIKLILLIFSALAFPLGAQTADGTTKKPATLMLPQDTATRGLVVPLRTVDITKRSALEGMYSAYVGNLNQYGYGSFSQGASSLLPRGRVPESYVLGIGDEVTIQLWGDPIDIGELVPQYSTKIQPDGTLFFPPVGVVRADGFSRAEVEKLLITGIAKKYKRAELKLQISSQKTFGLAVMGHVAQPGVVYVDPWTSLPEVLIQVGGIEKTGTLRNLRLTKSSGIVVTLDLYDLLLRGTRPSHKLEEGDVLFIGPVGKTAAISGQVRTPGIFELKDEEGAVALAEFSGGVLPSVQGASITSYYRDDSTLFQKTQLWSEQWANGLKLHDGDAFLFSGLTDPRISQEKPGFIRVQGEVVKPGFYEWSPGMTLASVLEKAGGVKISADQEGLYLTRSSVAKVQRAQVEESIQSNQSQIQTAVEKLAVTTDLVALAALNEELAARRAAAVVLASQLTNGNLGRILLDEGPSRGQTPVLSDDVVQVSRQDGVVLVLGAVYSPGAQIWRSGLTVRAAVDYVGGIQVSGDREAAYILKANGRAESVGSTRNFFGLTSFWENSVRPGDIVYIPQRRANDSQTWTLTKDVVAVLAQTTTSVVNLLIVFKTLGL